MILIKRGSLNNSSLTPFVTFVSHGIHVGITITHNQNHNTMASKRSTNTNMTNEVRIAFCEHKKKHPSLTQAYLITWLQETHNVSVSQGTISLTLKCSAEILAKKEDVNQTAKWQRTVKYPLMETALYRWFLTYQDQVNMSGDLTKEKASYFLAELYPGHGAFEFSNGWLEAFKNRRDIKSYCHFGESGSANMAVIEESLPHICLTLDQYERRDIYNMDETGLFYRMQVSAA